MSLARLYTVKKTRKEWTCTGCRQVIPLGSTAVNFAVGFRGRTQYRHAGCLPSREERESSAIAPIFGAIDSADFDSCETLDDIRTTLSDISDVIDEVAGDYESNEMYDVNEDLQNRVDVLQSASGEIQSWEPDEAEPEEDDEAHDAWLVNAIADARALVEDVELP